MVLAQGENDGFANFICDRVAQGIFKKGLSKDAVGFFREKFLFKIAGNKSLRFLPVFGGDGHGVAYIGKQLGGDFRSGIQHAGVYQESVFHAIEQRIAVGGVAAFAAKGGVGIPRHPALNFPGVVVPHHVLIHAFRVIPGRGGQAQFIAVEIFENRPCVARMLRCDSSEMSRSKSLGEKS